LRITGTDTLRVAGFATGAGADATLTILGSATTTSAGAGLAAIDALRAAAAALNLTALADAEAGVLLFLHPQPMIFDFSSFDSVAQKYVKIKFIKLVQC